jgi:hypothetical protein
MKFFNARNFGLGSAPASGAANDALVVGIFGVRAFEPVSLSDASGVRREGAPKRSRGGCAPHCVK